MIIYEIVLKTWVIKICRVFSTVTVLSPQKSSYFYTAYFVYLKIDNELDSDANSAQFFCFQ